MSFIKLGCLNCKVSKNFRSKIISLTADFTFFWGLNMNLIRSGCYSFTVFNLKKIFLSDLPFAFLISKSNLSRTCFRFYRFLSLINWFLSELAADFTSSRVSLFSTVFFIKLFYHTVDFTFIMFEKLKFIRLYDQSLFLQFLNLKLWKLKFLLTLTTDLTFFLILKIEHYQTWLLHCFLRFCKFINIF